MRRLVLWNGSLKPSECIDRLIVNNIISSASPNFDKICGLRAHYLSQETMCDHALLTMVAEIRRKLGALHERAFLPQILPYHAAYFLQAASIHSMFVTQLSQVLSADEFVDAVRPYGCCC
jgi:hypothetical protein